MDRIDELFQIGTGMEIERPIIFKEVICKPGTLQIYNYFLTTVFQAIIDIPLYQTEAEFMIHNGRQELMRTDLFDGLWFKGSQDGLLQISVKPKPVNDFKLNVSTARNYNAIAQWTMRNAGGLGEISDFQLQYNSLNDYIVKANYKHLIVDESTPDMYFVHLDTSYKHCTIKSYSDHLLREIKTTLGYISNDTKYYYNFRNRKLDLAEAAPLSLIREEGTSILHTLGMKCTGDTVVFGTEIGSYGSIGTFIKGKLKSMFERYSQNNTNINGNIKIGATIPVVGEQKQLDLLHLSNGLEKDVTGGNISYDADLTFDLVLLKQKQLQVKMNGSARYGSLLKISNISNKADSLFEFNDSKVYMGAGVEMETESVKGGISLSGQYNIFSPQYIPTPKINLYVEMLM
eukprot:TRINITY_DN3870_c0_g1_i1.p1 TRINITY_DN3870_c0_g1~~TRINITY_DN3870_c0_g1_i1.p1  ORF type:complete len:402 (+),score=67.84 TRINITY_DN3870_c0_g1_i1:188-1393(+)